MLGGSIEAPSRYYLLHPRNTRGTKYLPPPSAKLQQHSEDRTKQPYPEALVHQQIKTQGTTSVTQKSQLPRQRSQVKGYNYKRLHPITHHRPKHRGLVPSGALSRTR